MKHAAPFRKYNNQRSIHPSKKPANSLHTNIPTTYLTRSFLSNHFGIWSLTLKIFISQETCKNKTNKKTKKTKKKHVIFTFWFADIFFTNLTQQLLILVVKLQQEQQTVNNQMAVIVRGLWQEKRVPCSDLKQQTWQSATMKQRRHLKLRQRQ